MTEFSSLQIRGRYAAFQQLSLSSERRQRDETTWQKKGRLEAEEKRCEWVTSVTKGLINPMANSTWTITVVFPCQGQTVKTTFICTTCDFLGRNSEKPTHKAAVGAHATLPSCLFPCSSPLLALRDKAGVRNKSRQSSERITRGFRRFSCNFLELFALTWRYLIGIRGCDVFAVALIGSRNLSSELDKDMDAVT